MEVLLYALGALALAAGLAGLVLPVLPGAPLLLAGVLLLAWAGHFAVVGWGTVVAAAAVSVLILAVDWAAGVLGARAFGASPWAMVGALAGALIGLFLGIPGVILGPVAGSIALEYWKDPNFERAAKAGIGVLLGFVVGTAVKVALGLGLVAAVALVLLSAA